MCNDIPPFESDRQYLIDSFARWWKIPSEEQIELFCDRVARMVQDDEFSEDEARKISFERIIYGH